MPTTIHKTEQIEVVYADEPLSPLSPLPFPPLAVAVPAASEVDASFSSSCSSDSDSDLDSRRAGPETTTVRESQRPVLFGLCVLEHSRRVGNEAHGSDGVQVLMDSFCLRLERISPRADQDATRSEEPYRL